MAAFDDVAISPLGLAILDELNRRGCSTTRRRMEVFDAVAAELKARPAAERELARAVRRFGGN
jgi:hypothetical protein